MGEKPRLPLSPEEAKVRLQQIGATIMFEKVLTTSDVSGSGRIVIPKSIAEANFPPLENQNGMILHLIDVFGKKFGFRYRFWINNASRMYLIEGTQELQTKFQLAVGDVLVFARSTNGNIYVLGRKGVKEDGRRTPGKRGTTDSRKKPSNSRSRKRAATETDKGGASGTTGAVTSADAVDKNAAATSKPPKPKSTAPKNKRNQKGNAADASMNELQGMYKFWNGASLPARRDGVFRAVPSNSDVGPNRVLSQHGFWTAIVTLGGELYQAFFDSKDAASAALDAAIQDFKADAMSGNDEEKQPGKRIASLGWLTESSIQPKKRKEIQGVGAASLVALKSQVAKKQEEAGADISGTKHKHSRGNAKPRGGGSVAALLRGQNTGVEERNKKDMRHVKTAEDKLQDSRNALERKAALYDRLAAGAAHSDELERYEVDFLLKGGTAERRQIRDGRQPRQELDSADLAVRSETGGLMSADMATERERRAWESEIQTEIAAEEAGNERRQLIEELEQQTKEGRDRAAVARQEREYAEAKKRERLKAEFLKRRLNAAKSAGKG